MILKSIIGRITLSVFAFFAIITLLSYATQTAHAQEPSSVMMSDQEIPQDATTSAEKIDYNLAFPGILPDHPLYKIKVLRDKLALMLIGDPKKRIEYYLLQTDKGILATAMLVDKNEIKLAHETALKAEDNYTQLTFELKRLSEKPSPDFFKRLQTASAKHQEVLQSLVDRVPESEKSMFKTVLNFSRTNSQTVKKQEQKRTYTQ